MAEFPRILIAEENSFSSQLLEYLARIEERKSFLVKSLGIFCLGDLPSFPGLQETYRGSQSKVSFTFEC